jgi:hypothetical protein
MIWRLLSLELGDRRQPHPATSAAQAVGGASDQRSNIIANCVPVTP